MDRLNHIRGEVGSSRDLTLDTTSPPSEAFMTANESSSKYFTLSEVDSTFSISPSKDSLAATNVDTERTITTETELIANLSPIPKKSDLDSYKIGKQIEAANILSGGVNIFDDNDNSYDGDELVIDDNVVVEDEKTNVDLKLNESTELPLDKTENLETLEDTEPIPSKDTEVVLQIDGKNVDAIDIGNGLYLYRKAGQEELAAVQINNDDQQQPSFKFLKVRENTEGNLEVYEEIEIEIPKEVPTKEGNPAGNTSSHVPIKDISKMINEPTSNKVSDKTHNTPKNESSVNSGLNSEPNVELQTEIKSELNLNGKMMKFSESRKSPLIGTFTPMTYHSTPNKEGIPLTKTMVDQQLHPSRHSDNIKKTIEVHTDSCRQKLWETPPKNKDTNEITKTPETNSDNQDIVESEAKCSSTLTEETSKKELENEADTKDIDSFEKADISKEDNKEFEENCTSDIKEVDNLETLEETKEKETNDFVEEITPIKEEEKTEVGNFSVENVSENRISQDAVKSLVDETKVILKSNENNSILENKMVTDFNKKNNITIIENIKVVNDIEGTMAKERLNENHIETKLYKKPVTIEIKDITIDTTSEKEKNIGEIENTIETEEILDIESDKINEIKCVKEAETIIEAKNDNTFTESEINHAENSNLIDKIKEMNDHKISIIQITKTEETKKETDITQNIARTDPPCDLRETSYVRLETNETPQEILDDKSLEVTTHSALQDLRNDNMASESNNMLNSNDNNEPDDKTIREEKGLDKDDNKVKDIVNPPEQVNTECVIQLKEAVSQSTLTNSNKIKIDKNNPKTISKDTKVTNTEINTNKLVCPKSIIEIKTDIPKLKVVAAIPVNNNNSAVPFGKWTSANRQEFLNKIKETKIPSNHSNTKQLKQPNDLNRRDVLKKIDSQRQSATGSTKVTDFGTTSRLNTKTEVSAFVNKTNVTQPVKKQDIKVAAVKNQPTYVKQKPIVNKKILKEESIESSKEPIQRKEINNQDLIDKTIEGIINRAITTKSTENTVEKPTNINEKNSNSNLVSLDDIEKKMNELHGNPYEEQPPVLNQPIGDDKKNHSKPENSKVDKNSKIPNLVPFKNKDYVVNKKESEEISDEEILEHEPITGDIDRNKQNLVTLLSNKEKPKESKKEAIITEKDFDKFARRNSITYENRLTMSFDGKEPHNVIQTVVEKDPPVKKLSRNELMLAESKAKSTIKQHNIAMRHSNQLSKIPTSVKVTNEEDTLQKNYQSKVQIAYQSVLTAKKTMECPITIIEDKPVKVVYMDANAEFMPAQLNVQGQELSPPKKQTSESSDVHNTPESLDMDVVDSHNEIKPQEDTKFKIKHQRKQVLTPVEEPELELIEPEDLGIEVSPKKKRKLDDKLDKVSKNVVPKKSYLLNRTIIEDDTPKQQTVTKSPTNETEKQSETFTNQTVAISAIDNLVKAAELIETQEQKNTIPNVQSLNNSLNTPVKRGRGRPRKYPLPDHGSELKTPTPQKKPRLIDAKVTKHYTDSDESSDGEIIKENWTMGKINENIVCPICKKLFRSENVVFKHVKHCTGPSPNRSDSDKRSPIRLRHSSERKSYDSRSDFTDEDDDIEEENLRSRKSRHFAKSANIIDDVIVIEDTPLKERLDKVQKEKVLEVKKNITKVKQHHNTNNLICEFCGKTFRQLSYLVNHKIQHKKEDRKSTESEVTKSIFSCEVCKKEFRKPHHLVQHRITHNSNSMATRVLRKSSSEQYDSTKSLKNQNDAKQSDDPSAGFRCEPCDKSFRKLHHLVEHRETHDCINKKGTSNAQIINETNKPSLTHSCDICKKVFKKLQDYLEHKEQHLETSSEKSDDKSVKSSLSTKDIIHECSLCYMVFPNEHSLNKHTVICLRKKKQSAAKQAAKKTEEQEVIDADECNKSDENILPAVELNKNCEQPDDHQIIKLSNEVKDNSLHIKIESKDNQEIEIISDNNKEDIEKEQSNSEIKSNIELITDKIYNEKPKQNPPKIKADNEVSMKNNKIESNDSIIIVDTPTPKKKLPNKDKNTSTVAKRLKTVNVPQQVVEVSKPKSESSDDDEIRYMLNPNYKEDESSEGKLFMKVRAKKRNSLQIERPNSKDLIKRRISLQHPPKIPRLKVKAVEPKPLNSVTVEKKLKLAKREVLSYTDSDDSDVKYSFPTSNSTEVASKDVDKKNKKQSMATKRKSLSGIAKRKSMGKHKLSTPTNKIKKRTSEIEHRCDCGQLFSSAALLSRHTTLAHTPPRIRRRRSPPPDVETPKSNKSRTNKTKSSVQSKKLRSDVTNSNTTVNVGIGTRKSSVNNSEAKVTNNPIKTVKIESCSKKLRSSAHRGVPVPEKMRKLMEKTKK